MVRKENELAVQELTEKIKSNSCVVLTEYQGLTVSEFNELRKKLRPSGCEYTVVKNTLTKLALKNLNLEEFAEHFEGPTAIAYHSGDPVPAAKALVDFSKDHNKLKLKVGLLDEKVLSENELKSLANLPPKEILIAKFLGTLNAPIQNLVSVLQANIRNIASVLDQIRKQKEGSGK